MWRTISIFSFFWLILGPVLSQSLVLEANDLLRFQPAELIAQSGQKVIIQFKNRGKIASLKHQFILLKMGVDVDQFGNELIGSDQSGALPAGLVDKVIVASAKLGPGEETQIEFVAPAPGSYTFICGFPGHHSVSRGQMIIK